MSKKTNLDSLFEAALEIEAGDERAAFIDESCGSRLRLQTPQEAAQTARLTSVIFPQVGKFRIVAHLARPR